MKPCWRPVVMAVLVGWLMPFAAFAAEDMDHLVSAISAPGEQAGGTPASASEVAQYAEREQQANVQQQFAGGDDTGIYIGGGALLVLVVVLLILLLR